MPTTLKSYTVYYTDTESNATNLNLIIILYIQPKLDFINTQLKRLSHLLTIPSIFKMLLSSETWYKILQIHTCVLMTKLMTLFLDKIYTVHLTTNLLTNVHISV